MVLTSKDWLSIVLLVAADQIAKAVVVATNPNNAVFQLLYNTGAAWGMLQDKNWALLGIGIVVLALIIKPLREAQGRERTAFLLLAAGIIGNGIDRAVRGHVVDFVSIGSFPVFNLADSMITVGVVYLVAKALVESFRSWHFTKKSKR